MLKFQLADKVQYDGSEYIVTATLKGDYLTISQGDIVKTVHSSHLSKASVVIASSEPVTLGSGRLFSSKAYMTIIQMIIVMEFREDFQGFEYINEATMITKFGNEHKTFKVEYIDYKDGYFRWTKDSFLQGADYLIQLSPNYLRVFDAHGIRYVLGELMKNVKKKVEFKKVKNNRFVSGGVSANKEMTRFGCHFDYVKDGVSEVELNIPDSN